MGNSAAAALKMLRRPQDQDTLDPPSVKMREVPGIAGQQTLGRAVNRRQ
jgi:hypothetical protein